MQISSEQGCSFDTTERFNWPTHNFKLVIYVVSFPRLYFFFINLELTLTPTCMSSEVVRTS